MLSFNVAFEDPLKLLVLVRLFARLRTSIFRLHFVIAEKLAVAMVLDVAFVNEHMRRTHEVQERKLLLLNGDSVVIKRVITNEISNTN